MYNKITRSIAGLLAIVLLLSAIPFASLGVNAAINGDKKTASLDNIGNLGTVNIGSKSESGIWLKTMVNGHPVFCLDLGKACHTGYVYEASNSTISSDSSNNKTVLKAKIGYWYSAVKKKSNKAWVYAQCLIWSVEEGMTSESGLKNVIKQVKDNTGYYSNDTIYSDIFEVAGTVQCDITLWKFNGGSSSQVQELMEINGEIREYDYKKYSKSEYYRQRITLQKNDEDGKGIPQVTFNFTAKNFKDLYSYKFNGWGSAESGDADTDATTFSDTVQTDSTGMITFRFTYKIQSKSYYYVEDDELKTMSSSAKKEMKDTLDDEGYSYASDLSESGAKKLAQDDLDSQFDDISNQYIFEETSSGNSNILSSFTVTSGSDKVVSSSSNKMTIKLTKDDSWTKNSNGDWPETANETYSNYSLAYKPVLLDKFKKVSFTITKKDNETGTTAQGDAKLSGAVYGVYSDSGCTKLVKSYTTDANGQFETDNYRCGANYYLKEITSPEGYLKNDKIYTIITDGTRFTEEYNKITSEVNDGVVKGHVEITKVITDGDTGEIPPEVNATFQIYLTSAGSYEAAKDSEKQTIKTDSNGYAKTKDLPYGKYTVHQSGGDNKTEFVKDFYVSVKENGKPYTYILNNKPYEVYLKVIKKDARTGKTVLKARTTYQIYSVDDKGKQTLIKQQYNDGHKFVTVNTFVSDESGEIITYEKLPLGKYIIKEVEAAEGYWNGRNYVEIEITNSSYEIEQDNEGNQIDVATCEYVNDEAVGYFTITKKGEILDGYDEFERKEEEIIPMSLSLNTLSNSYLDKVIKQLKNQTEDEFSEDNEEENIEETEPTFQYIWDYIKNVKFEVYAKEDIVTQDNQGTNWFDKDELVAAITIGEGAIFSDDCNGLCDYELNKYNGSVSLYLPLGKYVVKEVQTNYGYVLPEENSWDIEFEWQDQISSVVYNQNGNTDENGTLLVKNDRAKAKVSILKTNAQTKKPVDGVTFGFYTKDDIYDFNGNVILEANSLIETVITDENGYGEITKDIPLMEEYFDGTNEYNSGDYYFKELSISDSYYLDDKEIPVHLEYVDQETPVIEANATMENIQTEVEIDKYSVAASSEIPGCHLVIKDKDGNEIVGWTTGDADSIVVNEKSEELGYKNLSAELNENGSIVIKGLLHSQEYVLTETKPADGYVTASDIAFKFEQNETESTVTDVYVKVEDEFSIAEPNKVIMYDDTTKVEISKTDITGTKELPGCEMEVTDKESGTVIESWTSTETTHMTEYKFVVGRTYTLAEKKPAKGYVTAESIDFTIADTGEVQKVQMKDDTTKVEFRKIASNTKKLIKGAKYKVVDDQGKTVYKFTTSNKNAESIVGKLEVGKTYTFVEVKAPDNYKKAKDVKITIKNTGKVQKVKAVDERIPIVPDTPKTGRTLSIIFLIIALIVSLINIACLRINKDEEREEDKDKNDKEDN